jgi:2-polyprenyl-6-methoxyphenol hydroxylase-like FAD-dependent oxidoreductase
MSTDGIDHDVVIVGARCAGAATAMLLARQGLDVLVVDRAELPSDTLSTHAIARGGVVLLARWGLLDAVLASGAPPIRTVTFHIGDEVPVPRTVKDRSGVDLLVAPRRYVLDELLLDEARRAGAAVETGVSVTDVVTDASGRVGGVHLRDRHGAERVVRARVVIGADGVRSRIARAVGAKVIDERAADGAAHYVYVAGLDGEGFDFYVGHRGFAGIFRTHDGEGNVWVCVPAGRALRGTEARTEAFLELLAEVAPSLADRVRAARITAPVRSAVGFPNHVLEATGPGWALVGDAGYHRDPVTGHGITDAFRDAELLAAHLGRALRGEASEAVAMQAFADERLTSLRPIFDVTTALAAYPPVPEFSELQRELSVLLDAEAEWLASLPPLPRGDEVVAA